MSDPAGALTDAILAATPTFRDGTVLHDFGGDGPIPTRYGDPRPVAARQAAAFARWLADHAPTAIDDDHVWFVRDLDDLADQLTEETHHA